MHINFNILIIDLLNEVLYNYTTYIIDVALTDELNTAALSIDPQVVSVSTAVLHKQFHTCCGIRGYMNHGSTGGCGQALQTASGWNVRDLLVAVTKHLQSAKRSIVIEVEVVCRRKAHCENLIRQYNYIRSCKHSWYSIYI